MHNVESMKIIQYKILHNILFKYYIDIFICVYYNLVLDFECSEDAISFTEVCIIFSKKHFLLIKYTRPGVELDLDIRIVFPE